MCGIAGIVDLVPGLPVGESLVEAMTEALSHRGPDDAGILVDPPVLLGHRRLSILDLSDAGHQPMASDDLEVWITYNGEVYNYVELGRELRARGHRFRSSSDTEVLLRAYEEWGVHAFPRLNGDFALAIWDRRRRLLVCARDRLGVKPFYYSIAGGRFRFGSEIKALVMDAAVPRRPNEPRILDFLAHGLADHTNETMFEGIWQLPPGTLLTVSPDAGVSAPLRWYTFVPAPVEGDPVETVRELVIDAVRLRLRSDVPVGTALSGGMDSSSVLSVAARLRRQEGREVPEAFSARCADPRLDEGRYARTVVRATGARHRQVLPPRATYSRAWTPSSGTWTSRSTARRSTGTGGFSSWPDATASS